MLTLPPKPDSKPLPETSPPSKPDLQEAAIYMDAGLQLVTGLKDLERKLVVYWALGTHALRSVNAFPLLVLRGKMGTGKSQTERIINRFARKAHPFSLRSMTLAALRDELSDCYEGTAIIEEADHAWHDGDANFERQLSDRYHRNSAEAALKRPSGERDWVTIRKKLFGATVLHRRMPFHDAALDGRSVPVRFRPDHKRIYEEYSDDDPWIVEGAELARNMEFVLPSVTQPPGVAARIFNTYSPLLSVAQLCGDDDFAKEIYRRLQQETLELKEAQGEEPDGLVLRAIVEAIFLQGKPKFGYIKLSTLAESIYRNTPRVAVALLQLLAHKGQADVLVDEPQ
jgi:hypothetical protein